jgi:lipid A 3-O-deacylase
MRLWPLLVLLNAAVWNIGGASLLAQSADNPPPAERHATEWAFTTGGAANVGGGARGGDFWALQLRWGKVLTSPHGPGPLRGTLEYAFEIVPAMILRRTTIGQTCISTPSAPAPGALGTPTLYFDPCDFALPNRSSTAYGGGFNPFFWQYNFTSHPRVVPYFNLGAGMLFTSQDFPADTSSFNFTPQGGIGAYWFAKPNRAVNFGVRYHHISNAGITKPNPGHNSLYFYGGFSWWR